MADQKADVVNGLLESLFVSGGAWEKKEIGRDEGQVFEKKKKYWTSAAQKRTKIIRALFFGRSFAEGGKTGQGEPEKRNEEKKQGEEHGCVQS